MLNKWVCLVALLGMVGTVNAADGWADWTGAGDGWDFNNPDNWDIGTVLFQDWRTNVNPIIGDLNITITSSIATRRAYIERIADNLGANTHITLNGGVHLDMTNTNLEYWTRATGSLTLKTGSFLDVRNGTFRADPVNSFVAGQQYVVTIEPGAELRARNLRHNNGTQMDVYGYLRVTNSVVRISAEGQYRLDVHGGGRMRVQWNVPEGGWEAGGIITVHPGGKVELQGDHSNPDSYLQKVRGYPDVLGSYWEVDYDVSLGGYTTLVFVQPCNVDNWADLDGDGDVDQDDFAMFQLCYSGDGHPYRTDLDYCRCLDRDQDGDVDADDFAAFMACATGPGIAGPPPGCTP